MKQKCKYCNRIIEYKQGIQFSCHCANCKSNCNVIAKYKKGINTRRNRYRKEFNITCKKCGNIFTLNLTINRYNKNKYRKTCSRSCAASYGNNDEVREKISKKLKDGEIVKRTIKNCIYCNKEMRLIPSKFNKKFCNKKCKKLYYRQKLSEYKKYQKDCKFTFSLNNYTKEFDFDIIKEYGWYSTINQGGNTNGINRDHMISIKYGFENKISPKIISHPANCELITHKKNIIKNKKCSITIEELKKRIQIWNKKYKGL